MKSTRTKDIHSTIQPDDLDQDDFDVPNVVVGLLKQLAAERDKAYQAVADTQAIATDAQAAARQACKLLKLVIPSAALAPELWADLQALTKDLDSSAIKIGQLTIRNDELKSELDDQKAGRRTYTIEEARKFFGVCRKTMRRRAATNEFPNSAIVGGEWEIPQSDIDAALKHKQLRRKRPPNRAGTQLRQGPGEEYPGCFSKPEELDPAEAAAASRAPSKTKATQNGHSQ